MQKCEGFSLLFVFLFFLKDKKIDDSIYYVLINS